MTLIKEILQRDLTKTIDDVIIVNQNDEKTVYKEITEYIATPNIIDHYRTVFDKIAKGPSKIRDEDEKVGFWISGFFGSGKSSFAKNLGYAIANPQICEKSASEIFKNQVNDQQITALIESINARLPTELIMFDIAVDKVGATERFELILYRKFLKHLGYSTDFDIAELEIELEKENGGKAFQQFLEKFKEIYPETTWETAREGASKVSRASRIRHEIDPKTYPAADSWSLALRNKHVQLSVGVVIDKIYTLMQRRQPNRMLLFVVDEVGQYVARSGDRLEELRSFTEQLGKEARVRMEQQEINTPFWLVVTSQEKLSEVVASIDNTRIQLAKIQDRFVPIDLSPADIREVATRRVLAKKPEAVPQLTALYRKNEGRISAQCNLERSSLTCEIKEAEFIQFYPYLPHFIELSIKIMSGIRLLPGATRHLGGGSRTIIKQAYEMLISQKTNLADKELGILVSLDKIFDLVEVNLSTEKKNDIYTISTKFEHDPKDNGWALKVAKAICLLEFVREVPRTEKNIASVLIEQAGQEAPITMVKDALARLSHPDARFIKQTEDGYKLLSQEERKWDEERMGFLKPKLGTRSKIHREMITEICSSPSVKSYRYKNIKNFKIEFLLDEVRVGEQGLMSVNISTADSPEELPSLIERMKANSHTNESKIFWAFTLTPEIDDLVAEYSASDEMIRKYAHIASQNKINPIDRECLETEKRDWSSRIKPRLSEKIQAALAEGVGIFAGVRKDGSVIGNSFSSALKAMLDNAVPDLFPKLEWGAVSLTGMEPETILKSANLSGLPKVMYDSEGSLGFVIRENQGYTVNLKAKVIEEIFSRIHNSHVYGGEQVSGKKLEEYFGGVGYAWDRDLIRLTLAVLFRAGQIEITADGISYKNYLDPQSWPSLTNNTKFKSAMFIERGVIITLKELVATSDLYHKITGEPEPDVNEAAIITKFKELANRDYKDVVALHSTAVANHLPVEADLAEYRAQVEAILGAAEENTFNVINAYQASLPVCRQKFTGIKNQMTTGVIATIQHARNLISRQGPMTHASCQEYYSRLNEVLQSPDLFTNLKEITDLCNKITSRFEEQYRKLHDERLKVYSHEVAEFNSIAEFVSLKEPNKAQVLAVFEEASCTKYQFDEKTFDCSNCHASSGQLRSDVEAVSSRYDRARMVLQNLTAPPQDEKQFRRVKLTRSFPSRLDNENDLNHAVEELRNELQKLIDEGFIIVPE
jgi:hypothetical protein